MEILQLYGVRGWCSLYLWGPGQRCVRASLLFNIHLDGIRKKLNERVKVKSVRWRLVKRIAGEK